MPDPKDPWGRRQDGVDDALRHVRDQFRQLPTGGIRSLLIAAVFLVVVWQGTFIVKPDEEGVVKRFGEVVRTAAPGPHLKIPFIESAVQPKVEKLHRVEIGFRTDQQGRQHMLPKEALMLTGDENIIGVEFIVQYKIKSAQEYLFNV